jgi:uncharacterized protein (UPF0333 family)
LIKLVQIVKFKNNKIYYKLKGGNKMNTKGQGSIEYLLLIAAAILVVSIVIVAITTVTSQGAQTVDADQVSESTQELECLNDINHLGTGTNTPYACCEQGFDNNNNGC